MSDKNKNKWSLLKDFLLYREGEMTGAERNSFERKLQKDPFAAEASEGFEGMTREEITQDLASLQKKLKSKTTKKDKLIYYRIAASVAVLAIVSSVFILVKDKKPEELISENVKTEKEFENSVTSPLSEPKTGEKERVALINSQPGRQKDKQQSPLAPPDKINTVKPITDQNQADGTHR
jgi:hypothetical protein